MKRKKDERVLPLGPVLENAVMGSLLSGKLHLKTVRKDELSKIGQVVYRILKEHEGQVSIKTVVIAATEVHGIEKKDIKDYLDGLDKDSDIGPTLQTLRRKHIINSLVNETTAQIASGEYSLLTLRHILESGHTEGKELTSLGSDKSDIKPPEAFPIRSLPRLTAAVGGVYGTWIVGGTPKAGKSTLTTQIAVSMAKRYLPCLYYDFELGPDVIRNRLLTAFDGDREQYDQATANFYLRRSISTLEADLDSIGKPCLIVVDSIQDLPTSTQHVVEDLGRWVKRLDGLKQRGHHVIMVSEVNRFSYGTPTPKGYKGSGEIEYAADVAITAVLTNEEDPSIVDLYVTENRHFRKRGLVCQLERVNSWWWKERGHNNA